MRLRLHKPEVSKPGQNTQCLELGKQSKGAVQTSKDKQLKDERNKTEQGKGAYLLSAKSPGTGSSPGRGLHEK